MRSRLLRGLTLGLVLAGRAGAAQQVDAQRANPIVANISACDTQTARFTVQVSQGIAIVSPKRLVVYGDCFAQGASITIWDYTANVSLTNGWTFVPSNASEHTSYTVPGAQCRHLLLVVVQDVAHNSLAGGNGKTYGPCQAPPPVFAQ